MIDWCLSIISAHAYCPLVIAQTPICVGVICASGPSLACSFHSASAVMLKHSYVYIDHWPHTTFCLACLSTSKILFGWACTNSPSTLCCIIELLKVYPAFRLSLQAWLPHRQQWSWRRFSFAEFKAMVWQILGAATFSCTLCFRAVLKENLQKSKGQSYLFFFLLQKRKSNLNKLQWAMYKSTDFIQSLLIFVA